MTKKRYYHPGLKFAAVIMLVSLVNSSTAQKAVTNSSTITANELKSHITFLSSDELEGRSAGERGMEIATRYLATEAMEEGLEPANGNSYLQPYILEKNTVDYNKSGVFVTNGSTEKHINKPIYQIIPFGGSSVEIKGEVIFAGYGITSQKYSYDDFADLETEGKILLIMNRAPMNEDGSACQFEEEAWTSTMNLNMKYMNLMYKKPKAILIVMDPKSGFSSFDEASPGITGYLSKRMSLKGSESQQFGMPGMPPLFIIHREAADAILEGTGKNLDDLQKNIDKDLKPESFLVEGKTATIKTVINSEEVTVNNVAAIVKGSDPELSKEYIIYSAHMDHLGVNPDGKINHGADDDATGCAALLEIAEAFSGLKQKPARSILFLWVSSEEIGLFGSQFYTENPLVPLDNTLADINIDMIGRTRTEADTAESTPVTDAKSVFLIGGFQSSDLKKIAIDAASKQGISLDEALNSLNHPLNLFSRSDHYNFVQKDVPVLFFTTGLHADYHTPADVVEKIDFSKMEKITRALYEAGYNVASRKKRIEEDNPFSTWKK